MNHLSKLGIVIKKNQEKLIIREIIKMFTSMHRRCYYIHHYIHRQVSYSWKVFIGLKHWQRQVHVEIKPHFTLEVDCFYLSEVFICELTCTCICIFSLLRYMINFQIRLNCISNHTRNVVLQIKAKNTFL